MERENWFFSTMKTAGETPGFQKSLQNKSLILCNLQGPVASRTTRREEHEEDRMLQSLGSELVEKARGHLVQIYPSTTSTKMFNRNVGPTPLLAHDGV